MLRMNLAIHAVMPFAVLLIAAEVVMAAELKQDVDEAIKQARKTGATMLLPENIHSQTGLEAARQTVAQFNAPDFEEKLCRQQASIQGIASKQEPRETRKEDGALTIQESVYLFLSSSMPEAVVNRYLIDIGRTGDQRISPVLFGLPQGMGNKHLNAAYFSRVMQTDLGCQERPDSPCQRLEMPVRVNPMVFTRYSITEVPALVYDNGQDAWSIRGDAELAHLLEKVGKAANSPAVADISARLRGAR